MVKLGNIQIRPLSFRTVQPAEGLLKKYFLSLHNMHMACKKQAITVASKILFMIIKI